MKPKFIIFSFIVILISFILLDLSANLLKIRPLLWKNSFYSYLNVGWYTWHGADFRFENEVHAQQINKFKTRGNDPDPILKKNIILLGDSYVETSHKKENMPENFLKNNFENTAVISFGSWGWANDQQLIHLKNNIHQLKKPDVILWFQLNDISDNSTKHGFLGSKPTYNFEIKNGETILVGPHKMPGKNYFEYSYTYRALNKLKDKYKLKNEKKITSYFLKCSLDKENYYDKADLLDLYYTKDRYEKTKKIYEFKDKPYNLTNNKEFLEFSKWKEKNVKNYLTYNKKKSLANGSHEFSDPFKFNRKIISKKEKENEILTSLLLNEIQEITNKNGGNFYLFFIKKKHLNPFPTDTKYKICHNEKEIEYSNLNFDMKLSRIFKGLKNIYVLNLSDFGNEYYDLFDGHLNIEANKFVMKKLSDFIKEN